MKNDTSFNDDVLRALEKIIYYVHPNRARGWHMYPTSLRDNAIAALHKSGLQVRPYADAEDETRSELVKRKIEEQVYQWLQSLPETNETQRAMFLLGYHIGKIHRLQTALRETEEYVPKSVATQLRDIVREVLDDEVSE